MAPTVYFADISPAADNSDSDTEESQHQEVPTVVLGYGVSDLRIGRRMPMVHNERGHHPYVRRLMSEASRHPSYRDSKTGAPPTSIGSSSMCSILGSNQLNSKSRTRLSHLVLLKRRKGLLDITLRTVALIRRNQQLQLRLTALQAETKAFVRSVMSNPENQGLQQARARSLEDIPNSDNDEDTVDK